MSRTEVKLGKMNRRQQLITQLRSALNQLETPERFAEETVCFTVGETEFEFDKGALNMEADWL